eukprot:TRINITY_DN3550_c0_g1_i1.p1 TRINITY_DN3550_c0_g1~~TRINITY_DN3550_c0_g1_i1.p1  ORF type:complete len:126 (+),score=9.01 TRINITY_DN3550_c0_g1_i1:60-437(+)
MLRYTPGVKGLNLQGVNNVGQRTVTEQMEFTLQQLDTEERTKAEALVEGFHCPECALRRLEKSRKTCKGCCHFLVSICFKSNIKVCSVHKNSCESVPHTLENCATQYSSNHPTETLVKASSFSHH